MMHLKKRKVQTKSKKQDLPAIVLFRAFIIKSASKAHQKRASPQIPAAHAYEGSTSA
jgi:hypothetical protein